MRRKSKSAYLVIAHGTRKKQGRLTLFRFVEKFQKAFPDRRVQPAFLKLCRPSIREGIECCVEKGAEEIFVLPLMLFPGRPVEENIPCEIQEAKRRHPHVDFHYSGALALASRAQGCISEPKIFELLLSKISALQEN